MDGFSAEFLEYGAVVRKENGTAAYAPVKWEEISQGKQIFADKKSESAYICPISGSNSYVFYSSADTPSAVRKELETAYLADRRR